MITSIKNRRIQTHLNQIIIALNPTSTFQSLSLLPHTGLFGTWLTLAVCHLLLNFPVFSSDEKANQYCEYLRTVLDKHAPPFLRKVINHNSSPWFESISDELFIAKRKRRLAERKLMNTKLSIFKDLYRQAKHKV